MKYHHRELDIENKNPFKLDLMARQEYAEMLFKIINGHKHPLTIALDDEWGNGKSTFAKMWENHLTNQGVPCIYIDAFASDYCQDPFEVVTSAIISYEKSALGAKNKSEIADKCKKLAVCALGDAAPYALSLATGGVISKKIWERVGCFFKKIFTKEENAIGGDSLRLGHGCRF